MTTLQFDLPKEMASIIKVVGVGGGGSNAVNHMHEQGIVGVNFVVCNTDQQALEISKVPNKIQLGPKLTQGLGAGSNPEFGMNATEESIDEVRRLLSNNTKMVFVTAGMGGGTGTGGAPVVARIAREMGILTVGIVTTPFSFEGKRKYNQALEGIERLKDNVDTILVISNDKIREMYGNARQSDAFNHANNILAMAAKSISEIITVPGYINVVFADVKYVMLKGGSAIMGCASAEGENRAMRAVQGALNSPLLNDNDVRGAKKILVNISSGEEQVTIDEITEINEYIQEVAKDTDIIFGTCDDAALGNKISVTIIATGFEATSKPAYLTPVNKIVRDLNEEVKEKQTVAAPIVEKLEVKAPVVNQIILNLDETPSAVSAPKVEETPAPVVNEVISEPVTESTLIEEEAPYSLFTILETDQVKTENENTFVFELSHNGMTEIQEEAEPKTTEHEVYEPHVSEIVEETKAVETPMLLQKGEEKEEESFVVFNVKSYETHEPAMTSKSHLDQQLNDRKRILSQLSYRSLNKSNMSELEQTPAYLRKGVEVEQVSHSTNSEMSRYTITEDPINQRPEVKKNNSFLHDNVD